MKVGGKFPFLTKYPLTAADRRETVDKKAGLRYTFQETEGKQQGRLACGERHFATFVPV